MSVRGTTINGRLTGVRRNAYMSNEDAKPHKSENSRNNSWIVNGSGNVNNYNK